MSFETPEQRQELSERLDRMWDEHIVACLAIINEWQRREREHKEDSDG